jgi:hypothetical protein
MPKKKITKLNPKGTLISRVVVVKWTPWKDGKTPIAGEDYKIPDRWEDGYTPIKGVDYFDGEDWYTPTTDDLLALILPNIPNPIPWKDWKDWIDGESVPEEKIYEMVEKVVGTIEVPTIEIWEDRNGQWIEKDWKKTYIKSVSNIWAWMSTGVVDFTALRDTPSSYVGQASKVVKVKADETGLEFIAWGWGGAVDSVNWQTGVVVLDTDDISEWTNKYNVNHTGDATGATALTLATVNSNVGSFTNANITVNAKGLITAAANGSGWSGSPGWADKQVQFNDGGVFGTDTSIQWDKTTNQLSLWNLAGTQSGAVVFPYGWGVVDTTNGSWIDFDSGGAVLYTNDWVWPRISDSTIWFWATLDLSGLTDDRNIEIPNWSGTLPLVLSVWRPWTSKTNDTVADQDFTSLYAIPANTLATNKVVRLTINFKIVTGVSTATIDFYLKLGGTKVVTTTSSTNVANSSQFQQAVQFLIVGTQTVWASKSVEVVPLWPACPFSGAGATTTNNTNQPVAGIATNGALTLVPWVAWSATGSTETLTILSYMVEYLN